MKKFPHILLIFLQCVCLPAFAANHISSFGFSMDLPAGWTVFSQQEVKDNPDLFDLTKNPIFSKMDPNVVQMIQQKLQSGSIELYFHYGVGSATFTDNINIIKQIEQIPPDTAGLQKLCAELPAELSQAMGQETTIYQCSLTKVGGKNTLFLEFGGAVQQTRSVQYQIQKSGNIAVIITGTFTAETLEKERATLAQMMQSVKF